MAARACNPTTQEAKEGGYLMSQLWQCSEFQKSLASECDLVQRGKGRGREEEITKGNP